MPEFYIKTVQKFFSGIFFFGGGHVPPLPPPPTPMISKHCSRCWNGEMLIWHYDLPLRAIEHAGNVVHDGNMNKLLGFSDHVKNSIDVRRSSVRAEWWWWALQNIWVINDRYFTWIFVLILAYLDQHVTTLVDETRQSIRPRKTWWAGAS